MQANVGTSSESESGTAFSPDGKYLAVNERTQIKLWDIASGRPLRTMEHFAYFLHVLFVGNGEQIVSAHKDGWLRTWETVSGKMLSQTKVFDFDGGDRVTSMRLDPSGNLIVASAFDGNVVIWDWAKRQRVHGYRFAGTKDKMVVAEDARISKDGSLVITAGENLVTVYDLRAKRTTRTVALTRKDEVFTGSVLDERTLLVKSEFNDCQADLVLVEVGGGQSTYRTIDPAPGCKKSADGSVDTENSGGDLSFIHREAEGRLYVARNGRQGIKVWDIAERRQVGTLSWFDKGSERLVAVDRTGSTAAVSQQSGLRIVKMADGSPISRLETLGRSGVLATSSHDGSALQIHYGDGNQQEVVTWPIAGVTPRFNKYRLPDGFKVWNASVDADLSLATDDKDTFVVTAMSSGKQVARFSIPGMKEVYRARLSPDGTKALIRGEMQQAARSDIAVTFTFLVDARTGEKLITIGPRTSRDERGQEEEDVIRSFAFSPDGKQFAVGWQEGSADVWNVENRRLVKRLQKAGDQTTNMYFSPDGKYVIGGSRDSGIFIWSMETGRLMKELERSGVAGHVNTGGLAVSHDNELVAAGPEQRATSSGDIGRERGIQVWELATGKRRFVLRGHESNVSALAFTRDKRWIVSGSYDGTIRYWDRKTGQLAATFATGADGQWVIVTEKGFFAASSGAGNLLSVVRGYQAIGVDQLWQSLYGPDLVRDFIAGDPNGEVKAAAANAELPAIIDGGPAPTVAITAPAAGSRSTAELVEVSARILDQGKGIGRIEWRINGVTAAVIQRAPGEGQARALSQKLALDPGENTIEVVAYTAANLLASSPARTTIKLDAGAAAAKPNLHVMAIGINTYVDRGWTPPGKQRLEQFAPLGLAVADATAFTTDLGKAASGLYGAVKVTTVLDAQATRAGLEAAIAGIAAQMHPRDTFVLYAAAHGISENGRFYLIPQDYQHGPGALAASAVGQDMLQDWLANRIKAKHAVILLDTCESGALVSGQQRSRANLPASESALGRLHEATGRPVLTAAATGKPALEGYKSHGVFTWALMDALRNGDADGNGTIELAELVAHVQDRVPRISAELQGTGRAAVQVTRKGPEMQSARFGSRGENFPLVRRLQ